ncbi:hypothetical protein BRARA_A02507 [Brassica rapa]|uniref:non-specific serine/threonine protein kinase n=1 Tax=Brassica campestris TaxID=3711 RepID=A0A398APZ6_BRACM|nr:hypothetical protein BRARA_A02507 [Brassica rapa]
MEGGADGTVRVGGLNSKPGRGLELESDSAVSSPVTRQKAAAAKQFIENHYKNYLQGLHERMERRREFQRKVQEAQLPVEEQDEMMRNLARRETEYMRLQRRKIGIDDFELLTVIGKGAFGEVRLCRLRSTGEVYAMKKLKKTDMLSRGQVEHVRSERNLLAEVDSRYIVKLFYSFQDSECLYLIMEYLPGGDIMTLLMREDILAEDVARFYIAESILAIHSIHHHNYVHRDIKPDNLILDKSGHLKLSDFGLCKPLDEKYSSLLLEDEEMLSQEAESQSGKSDSDKAPWQMPKEQLLQWKRNRRALAYSTVGTLDYMAPEAAYRPTVDGELDTQNFEKFPEVEGSASEAPQVGPWRKMLTSKDNNFIGFTFKKSDITRSMENTGTDMKPNGSGDAPSLISLLGRINMEEAESGELNQKT